MKKEDVKPNLVENEKSILSFWEEGRRYPKNRLFGQSRFIPLYFVFASLYYIIFLLPCQSLRAYFFKKERRLFSRRINHMRLPIQLAQVRTKDSQKLDIHL